MSINTSTLRPGLLVGLKTSITGNVKYSTQTIEGEHLTDSGSLKARWETERTVSDPAEHAAATQARAKARHAVERVCSNSAFGLLCPEANANNIEEAIAEARKIAADFNATATYSRMVVNVITGRIAADDVEAVRAINSEIRDLMETMERGISNLDVKSIRDAANRAKSLGAMLTPGAAQRVELAITSARTAARKIAAAGETAAQEVDLLAIKWIAEQRTAFLDMDDAKEVEAPIPDGRSIDLAPSIPSEMVSAAGAERVLDLQA